jgi:hypothetical protein
VLGALAAAGLLLTLLVLVRSPAAVIATAALLAVSVTLCASVNERNSRIIPDGAALAPQSPTTQPQPKNLLAYMDTSHLGAATEESWRNDGTMGLGMGMMRDGYLVLTLPRFDYEQIRKAAVVVTVAPHRPFSSGELDTVRKFVEEGGVFICTVGYDHAAGSRTLMSEFGFDFGEPNDPRPPHPWGHFKSPYLDFGNGRYAYVRFDAGWPIRCSDLGTRVIAYGPGNKPVLLVRPIGQGKFVLVGDTGFAMNKNLEHEGGEPFEGMRENADFWRWFLPEMTGQDPHWMPSPPATQPAAPPPASQPAVAESAAGGKS